VSRYSGGKIITDFLIFKKFKADFALLRTIFTILPIWLVLFLPSRTAAETTAATDGGLTRVPVQVVTREGVETKWVMIEVAGESVPEPGSLVLLLMSGLLLMRRRRN
jgi:hypothetical protein